MLIRVLLVRGYMCKSPLRIQRYMLPENLGTRYDIIRKYVPFEYRNQFLPYGVTDNLVPCGKCSDCLKNRQNEISVRASLEAVHRGSMHFVTLTYRDSELPIACRTGLCDKSTGEYFFDSKAFLVDVEDSVLGRFRGELLRIRAGKKPRYYTFYDDDSYNLTSKLFGFYDDSYAYSYCFTPSLRRRDVALWIKNCRVKYKRHFGEKLDFTYLCCGEMGTRTCRPHYHVALFGLDTKQVRWMCEQWEFGFSQVKQVNRINKDGSKGFIAASRYIGKYVSKGCFECKSVVDGMCERPRLCMSIGLGSELTDSQISYYRAYDIFGWYDIDNPFNCDKLYCLSISELHKLFEEVQKRKHITIEGKSFHLPKYLLKKLWYVKSFQKKVPRPSTVQMVFNGFLCSDDLSNFVSEFKSSFPYSSSEDICKAVSQKQAVAKVVSSLDEQKFRSRQQQFYLKSKF